MRVIAVTGGIGCGKSTVTRTFRRMGARVIDADGISRALTAPRGAALPEIRRAFGDGVFSPDGTLDRRALAAIVFADEAARKRLNAVLHPMIQAEMNAQIARARASGARLAVLDVPLLYEAGMETLADTVICVSAPERAQVERLRLRDGMSESQALARIRSQMPLAQKRRRADIVFSTDASIRASRRRAEALYRRLAERSDR